MSENAHPGPLYAALAKAQADMSNVHKDSKNPHFKSSFASLAAVRDVVIPALSKHGIAVVQMPGNAEGGAISIHTVLVHESGMMDCGTIATKADGRGGNAAQATGSALTYLRRYALSAIAGVAQEDDDGNASGPRRDTRAPRPQRRDEVPEFSEQHARNALTHVFGDLSDEANRADAEMMVKEATGFDIAGMLKSRTAREVVVNALRANARRGK